MVIADVTGKGVPAALFMALGHTLIRSSASTVQSPSAALVQANRLILEHSRSDLFLTAFYAVMDTRTGHVVHANAGHPRPLWWQAATGRLQSLGGRGIALGVLGEIELEECESDVAPGDLLVFYTDGVTEAMDADKQQFGLERLQTAVTASPAASAKQVLEKVVGSVQAFVGDVPQSDDLTLFVVRRCP